MRASNEDNGREYIKLSEEVVVINDLKNTFRRVIPIVHETRSIQGVEVLQVCRQCCSGYNQPLKFFICFVFGAFLPIHKRLSRTVIKFSLFDRDISFSFLFFLVFTRC